jgi:vesicle transport through interaction with t-SNAREs protein 1
MAHSYTPFQRYDEEFKSLKKQVQDSLGEEDDFDDEEVGRHTSNLISQCDELLQQMALEARSVADSGLKRELLAQVRTYKAELQSLKDEYNKKSLMAGAGGSRSGNNHRERLLQQQDMLLNQNSQLENARKVLEETEQVALEIGTELAHNRETIESAHGRVRSVAGLTGRAKRILTSMSHRQTQQKMILYGLAIGVVVFFLLVLWWMRR